MLYMIIERYRNGDSASVYERFRQRGRMAPQGVAYMSSWVTTDLAVCYQVMESGDRALLEQWMANWSDLVDFEVHEVLTSSEAASRAAARTNS